jgi:hypothetical protein
MPPRGVGWGIEKEREKGSRARLKESKKLKT